MGKTKGSKELHNSNKFRLDKKRKRKFLINRWDMKKKTETTATKAKILETSDDILIPEDKNIEYRIINFQSVFAQISQHVQCKQCGDDVIFQVINTRGLGFKIMISCATCDPTLIPSSLFINNSFEINRRFSFAMRCIGVGANGGKRFCALMDLPSPVTQSTQDLIQQNIYTSSKAVAEILMKNAVKEEQQRTSTEQEVEDVTELSVSGDGTWHKRGFSSAFGVATLIGVHSKKVLDINVKSSYCKACEIWKERQDDAEYEEWKEKHEKICQINHEGSSGKMEVDAIKEIFARSLQLYGVKYINYIGDGDSKTFKSVVASKPYGDDVEIQKKECIGHVQKRMGTRLRKCKKENKDIGGRNKLTATMIDKLSVYYGLAIRRNFDSVENMQNAIWATFHHYRSTAKNPHHELCPKGVDSWCEWQQAKTNGTLRKYKQSFNTLPAEVLNAIRPIYEDLSKDELLRRCLGGFTQNANESINNIIWKVAPKTTNSSKKIIEIASYIAVCLFNEGVTALLKIMHTMGIPVGRNATQYAASYRDRRVTQATIRAQHATREARIQRRMQTKQLEENANIAEDLFYGPGTDDAM